MQKPTVTIFLDNEFEFSIKNSKIKMVKAYKSVLGLRIFELFFESHLANSPADPVQYASMGIPDQKAISQFLNSTAINKSIADDKIFLDSFLEKLNKNIMTDVAASVIELIARFNAAQILQSIGKNSIPKLKFAGPLADKKFLIFRLKYHLKTWS